MAIALPIPVQRPAASVSSSAGMIFSDALIDIFFQPDGFPIVPNILIAISGFGKFVFLLSCSV
jgi:hypothetical protein